LPSTRAKVRLHFFIYLYQIKMRAEPLLKERQIQKVSVAAYHSKTQAQEITNYLKKNGYNPRLFRNEGLAHFKLEHISARS